MMRRGRVPPGSATDPEIVRHLLGGAGLTDAEIDASLPRLWERYVESLQREIRRVDVRALPGIRAPGPRGGARRRSAGVLTGNLREDARIKAEAAGIGFHRFRVGAFFRQRVLHHAADLRPCGRSQDGRIGHGGTERRGKAGGLSLSPCLRLKARPR
jgi:hypothetical protein